jgi:hypothetical protein|tara:strand:- start:1691 stop:1867 length:177 start_codon:yes stop_codon:yes gene_type:complete
MKEQTAFISYVDESDKQRNHYCILLKVDDNFVEFRTGQEGQTRMIIPKSRLIRLKIKD